MAASTTSIVAIKLNLTLEILWAIYLARRETYEKVDKKCQVMGMNGLELLINHHAHSCQGAREGGITTSMIEAHPSMPIHQVFPTLAYVPLGVKLPKVSCVQILNLL